MTVATDGVAVRPGWGPLLRLVPTAASATAAKALWTACALLVSLVCPAVIGAAADRVASGQDAGALVIAVGALLVCWASADVFGEIAGASAHTRALTGLRHRLAVQVFALGVAGTRRRSTGDVVNRVLGNAATTARAVPELVEAAAAGVASAGSVLALWWLDWRAGAAFVAALVPVVLLLRRLMNSATDHFGTYLRHLADIAARLTDALGGSRTIRACGTAEREVERVLAPLPGLRRAGLLTWEVRRAVSWQVGLALGAVRALVLAVAGYGVVAGTMSPGELLSVALYVGVALGVVQQVDTLMFLADARAHARRAHELLADRPSGRAGAVSDRDGAKRVLPAGPAALRLRGVSVRSAERTVLSGVDLDVPAGSALALAGRSGSGKTTLALVISGLLDPDAGQVLLGGVPLDEADPAGVRATVGYAPSRPVLLGRDIADALAYGRPGAGAAEVRRAARIAQAEEFVRRLPAGFGTPLSALHLSGGETQRLGLARAVLHGSGVLVLNDATSNLDTITEARLSAAVTTDLAERTRVIVAHRITTAARADAVAWLDDGRIRAVAPHSTLWDTEPAYRAVFAAGSAQ